MLQVGFKPTPPVFERAKAVHALDHVTTVIGSVQHNIHIMELFVSKLWRVYNEYQGLYILYTCSVNFVTPLR
jgi:hypothetical protein